MQSGNDNIQLTQVGIEVTTIAFTLSAAMPRLPQFNLKYITYSDVP